jgi:hypothetical protein
VLSPSMPHPGNHSGRFRQIDPKERLDCQRQCVIKARGRKSSQIDNAHSRGETKAATNVSTPAAKTPKAAVNKDFYEQ